MLRIDDIPQQVADDIHGFAVIWARVARQKRLSIVFGEVKPPKARSMPS